MRENSENVLIISIILTKQSQDFRSGMKEFHLLQGILDKHLHDKVTKLNELHILFGEINLFRLHLTQLVLSCFQTTSSIT